MAIGLVLEGRVAYRVATDLKIPEPLRLLLEPVTRGSGKLDTLQVISGPSLPATTWPTFRPLPPPPPPPTPLFPEVVAAAAAVLARVEARRSTRTRVNSTDLRSSTATIMSLMMVTSSP